MHDDPRVLVVSDVHFGAAPAEHERAFLRFLADVPHRSDELLINGDLFDFWFEYDTVVLREYFPLLRRLAELVEAGIRVRMTAGNHDAWGGSFLREEVGVEWLEGPTVVDVAGRRAYVAHGDGVAATEPIHDALRSVARSRPAEILFRLLHPDLGRRVVDRISRTVQRMEAEDVVRHAEALSERADQLLRRRPELDLVIFGHAHQPELRQVEPGRHYLNPGDWLRHCSYGIVERGEVRLERWRPGGSESSGGRARPPDDGIQPPPRGIS